MPMFATITDLDYRARMMSVRFPIRGRPEQLDEQWNAKKGSTVVAVWLGNLFGWLFLLLVASTALPLVVELWIQRGL